MATASTMIQRAMRLLSLTNGNEVPTTDELANGLTALNAMLESWSTERLNIFAFQNESLTLVAGQSTYTIGPATADLVTTRPIKIENAYLTENNIDYPTIAIVSYERWNAIQAKTSRSNILSMIYYEPTMPTGTLKCYPVPSKTNVLHLETRIQLTAFAALSTTVSLPPGYQRAIEYNLAVEYAPEFEMEASATVQRIATESKGNIMRANQRPMVAYPDINFGFQGYRHNIIADGVRG